MPHMCHILRDLIPEWHLVKSTDHEAPYYVIFFPSLSPCCSWA
jgi:hypothetical protein